MKRPKSPIPRVNDPRELERQRPVSRCSDRDLEKINRDLNPRNYLGILMGEGGKVPESDGVPRIFLMGLDSTGRDRRLTLEEKGIAFGSREFWQEAQMGNVFALPAGERTPVQLTVTLPERGDPQVIAHPEQRPLPPPGQFYSDQVGPMMNGRLDEYNIHPKPLLSMGTAVWRKNYDTIAERIAQDNRLGKLSNRELFLTMSGKEYTGKPLVEMGNLALAGKSTDPAERNLNVERESLRIQSEGLNL